MCVRVAEDAAVGAHARPTSPMYAVEAFMAALTNSDADGRIIVHREPMAGRWMGMAWCTCGPGAHVLAAPAGRGAKAWLRFLLLNPARQFASIVQDARAVVLAGGTMKPVRGLCPPPPPRARYATS
jgi:chromosome transmission fidelity protein 1